MRKLLMAMAALALCGCASSHDTADLLFSLTPEHFRDTAQIIDDPLDTVATVSMEPGYHEHNNLGRDGWACDSYLRAFIDKRFGMTSYQLYVDVSYISHGRRLYDTINYFSPQGVQSAPVVKIARDKASCRKDDCAHDEIIAFNMSETMLQQIAATYSPNTRNAWRFKLKGKIIGADMDGGIVPSEAAGLLMAVRAYKASLHRSG